MKNAGVNSKAYSVAMLLATSCGIYPLVKTCGAWFKVGYGFVGVEAPRDDRLPVRFNREQVVDVRTLGQEHEVCVRESAEEGDEHSCKLCDVVEGEAVEHLTHVEACYTIRSSSGFSDLFEHGVIVDVDFDEGGILSIDEREVAVCAVVGTAVR